MEEEAFYRLVEEVVGRIRDKLAPQARDKWIDGDEAMAMLRIKSKTTLQKLRDEGRIKFTQPDIGPILYDSHSILDHLEKHAKNTF